MISRGQQQIVMFREGNGLASDDNNYSPGVPNKCIFAFQAIFIGIQKAIVPDLLRCAVEC